MQTIQADVVVVGGGPSGAMAARELSRGGADVVLIEKNLSFDKPCGGGLFLKAFEEFDLPLSLVTKRVESIDIVAPDNTRTSVDIRAYPLGVVHRKVFDHALRDQAAASGARILQARARTVTPDAQGVTVQASDPSTQETYTLRATYLIAADGVNSSIRKQHLGAPPSRVLTWYADLPQATSEACQFWFGDDISPGYYAWIFPHHQGINVGLVADDRHRMNDFYATFFRRAELGRPPKPRGYYIPHWREQTLYRDRILYVGDSASLVLPFTYEGIYYALKSGRLAAQALLDDAPQSYPKNWNDLYRKKFRFLRILQTIFLRNDWFATRMSRLYRHPKFQRAVLGYWSGSREPAGAIVTICKAAKALIFYR